MKLLPFLLALIFACVGPIASAEEDVDVRPVEQVQPEKQVISSKARIVKKKIKELIREGAPSVGPQGAPVKILAFIAGSTMPVATIRELKHVIGGNPNKVRVVFKFTDDGKADAASWAADKQGKFWEMYQAMMSTLSDSDDYEGIAKQLGLDLTQLATDMNSSEFKDHVKQNQELMDELKIEEIPAFFVNAQGHVGIKELSRVVFEQLNFGGSTKPR